MSGGKKYQVVFYARSDANRTLQAIVQKKDSPYTIYGNQTVNLTTAWQKFSYTFTPGQSDSVFVGFNLAASGATVWLDGVYITLAPGAEMRIRTYLPVIKLNHN